MYWRGLAVYEHYSSKGITWLSVEGTPSLTTCCFIFSVKCPESLDLKGLLGTITITWMKFSKQSLRLISKSHMWHCFLQNYLNVLVDGRSVFCSCLSHSYEKEPCFFSDELLNGAKIYWKHDLAPGTFFSLYHLFVLIDTHKYRYGSLRWGGGWPWHSALCSSCSVIASLAMPLIPDLNSSQFSFNISSFYEIL